MLLLAATGFSVVVAACGGSSKSKSTTTHTATTTTHTAAHRASKFIIEQVHGAGSHSFASSVSAHPGEAVAFRTLLPASATSPETVTVTVGLGPSSSLTASASTPQHTSTATITGGGSSLTLVHLHYACVLPPSPTFCPAKKAITKGGKTQVQFAATHTAAITLVAVVGPVKVRPVRARAPGTQIVPAYRTTEVVKTLPGGKASTGSKTTPPTTSTTAGTGDVVEMLTRVTSKVHGALQPVTITFKQGPASTIAVSAAAKGGVPSVATIKAKSGSKITLVLPRYSCFLPPLPTFCPATKESSGSHGYSVTFMAAPGTSPPVIAAKVQAG